MAAAPAAEEEDLVEVDETRELRGVLQQLLDATFLRRRSCDRRGEMPGRLELRQILRRRHAGAAWERYVNRRAELRAGSDGKGWPSYAAPLRTAAPASALTGLEAPLESDECFLLHGTSPVDAESIAREGFDLKLAGSTRAKAAGQRKGSMFNTGVYLAECSSKADEYASDGSGRRGRAGAPRALMAMLLCRVALGRVLPVTRAVGGEGAGTLATTLGGAHDSLLGPGLSRVCPLLPPPLWQPWRTLERPPWRWQPSVRFVLTSAYLTCEAVALQQRPCLQKQPLAIPYDHRICQRERPLKRSSCGGSRRSVLYYEHMLARATWLRGYGLLASRISRTHASRTWLVLDDIVLLLRLRPTQVD